MRISVLAAAWLTLSVASAMAADGGRERLPQVRLQSQGVAVAAATLARPDPWILIYVDDDCRVCVEVLSETKADDIDRSRILVVASTDGGSGLSPRPSRIAWPPARVFIDSSGALATGLRLQGVPVIVGLVGDEIHWKWSGALPTAELRSLIASWLESHPAPAVPR